MQVNSDQGFLVNVKQVNENDDKINSQVSSQGNLGKSDKCFRKILGHKNVWDKI